MHIAANLTPLTPLRALLLERIATFVDSAQAIKWISSIYTLFNFSICGRRNLVIAAAILTHADSSVIAI